MDQINEYANKYIVALFVLASQNIYLYRSISNIILKKEMKGNIRLNLAKFLLLLSFLCKDLSVISSKHHKKEVTSSQTRSFSLLSFCASLLLPGVPFKKKRKTFKVENDLLDTVNELVVSE